MRFSPHGDLLGMPAEERRLWADALLSGEYRQCAGVLHQYTPREGHFFCCLGVRQMALAGLTIEDLQSAQVKVFVPFEDEEACYLHGKNLANDESGIPQSPWTLNDTHGMPFDVIAQLVLGEAVEWDANE